MREIVVNGETYRTGADPRTPFLEILREELGLKGTKYGCGEGECGACTVIVDGKPVCSCLTLTGAVEGAEVTTVEGMANDPVGTKLFNALAREGAVQCGFCTPGFVLSSWDLLNRSEEIDSEAVRDALSGNLCRCTGYVKIIDAVRKCAGSAQSSPIGAQRRTPVRSVRDGRTYWRPADLDELMSGLEDFDPEARLVAGGTDLMVQSEHRLHELSLIDLSVVPQLRGIEETEAHLRIGATTTWSEIRNSDLVKRFAPVLALAAAEIGGRQIQNRATIGGNVVNASPAADGLPALYAHEADVEIRSKSGVRTVPISDLIRGPGQTTLAEGEILTAISIPKWRFGGVSAVFFEKFGTRNAQAITKGSVTFVAALSDGKLVSPRIALGAVGPMIIRATEAERVLSEDWSEAGLAQARALVSDAARPIDDLRSTAEFRRNLIGGLLIRGLKKTMRGAS